jgi:hypothetical protein
LENPAYEGLLDSLRQNPSDRDLVTASLSSQVLKDLEEINSSPILKSDSLEPELSNPLLKSDPTNPYLNPNLKNSSLITDPESIPKHLSKFFQTHRLVFDWDAIIHNPEDQILQERSLDLVDDDDAPVFYVATPKLGFWFD